ncbi:hypothetical protein [Streptomyces sp. WMMC1477]|uniref:hypothetical protein n=1 Tax=Streptomyces sp. WMMC1477 TaxID=3015155 RepID=UPI0022B63A1B|nr:hypothetical protein [Streptomyces sp. WMMC1477]MCZ7434315.1 hypothetical protein [Streptomyces sp. WMMC1477]
MTHIESAHLVELALGNDVPHHDDGAALRHIASCERCSAELDRMTRVVGTARRVEEPDLPVAPPERVWEYIAEEIAGTDTKAAAPPRSDPSNRPGGDGSRRSAPTRKRERRNVFLVLVLVVTLAFTWWRRSRSARSSAGGC